MNHPKCSLKSGDLWDNKRRESRFLPYYLVCTTTSVWWNNLSSGEIWDIGQNLNILYSSILIVDNKNVFTYLDWLDISRVINWKPPNFEVFRLWLDFFPICECTREQFQRVTGVTWPGSSWQTSTNQLTSGRAQQALRSPLSPQARKACK